MALTRALEVSGTAGPPNGRSPPLTLGVVIADPGGRGVACRAVPGGVAQLFLAVASTSLAAPVRRSVTPSFMSLAPSLTSLPAYSMSLAASFAT